MPAFIDENQQFIDPDTSAPIVNGTVFFGEQGANPEDEPLEVFANRALDDSLGTSIQTDASGRTTQKVWIPGRYSFLVKNSAGSQKLMDLDAGSIESIGVTVVLTNIVGANNITASASPQITVLASGQQFTFTAGAINTDDMTLKIDNLDPKPILFNFAEQMAPGFIQQNATVNLTYNSTEDAYFWGNEGRGISLLTNVAGDGNDITADGGPSVTGYVDKQIFIYKQNTTNTGDVTLMVGTLPTISIKSQGFELAPGVLLADNIYMVAFNTAISVFELVSGAPFSGALLKILDTNGFSINESQGDAVASETQPNIWAGDGNTLHITGTDEIQDFTDAPRIGAKVTLIFDDVLLLKNGLGITLAGAADIVTKAGDRFEVYADAVDAFSGIYIRNVPPSSFATQLLLVTQEESATVNGGTFTSGDWRTRTLNTIKTNKIVGATLISNQINLPAGIYYVEASGMARGVNDHMTRLQNITGASTLVIGTREFTPTPATATTTSNLSGEFTLSVSSSIELQHRCNNTRNSDGFGLGSIDFGQNNTYGVVKIWKVG